MDLLAHELTLTLPTWNNVSHVLSPESAKSVSFALNNITHYDLDNIQNCQTSPDQIQSGFVWFSGVALTLPVLWFCVAFPSGVCYANVSIAGC